MPVISTYISTISHVIYLQHFTIYIHIYIFNLQSDSTINYAALLVIVGVTEEIGQRIAKATRDAVGRRRPYLAGAVVPKHSKMIGTIIN
jgi:membrane-bound acyltransferase YfiQ involved in biofilm formation